FRRMSVPHTPLSSAPATKSTMEKAEMKHNQQRKRTAKSERRGAVSLFERIHPDAAGVDCGQKSHFVAVPPERAPEPVREFRTFTAELHRLGGGRLPRRGAHAAG